MGRSTNSSAEAYLALVNSAPRAWGFVYRWLDRKTDFDQNFARLTRLKRHFAPVARPFSTGRRRLLFPGLSECASGDFREPTSPCKKCRGRHRFDHHQRIVVSLCLPIISSLRTNKARPCCGAAELRRKKSRCLDFPSARSLPISPQIGHCLPTNSSRRVLYMINAAKRGAPELVRLLAKLDLDLTVTIGRADELRPTIEAAADGHPIKIVGWTERTSADDAREPFAHRQSRWRNGAGNDRCRMSHDHQPRRRRSGGRQRPVDRRNKFRRDCAVASEKLSRRCSARSTMTQNNGANGPATLASLAAHALRSISPNF